MQPSRAQHPHEVPGDLQGVFISLARKSHTTTTTTTPKTFPRHQKPKEVGEEQQQQYKPFGTKKVPPASVEGLFPNQQSCDREETRRAAGKTPSPYTGSQGHSITLPYPKPLLSSDHANTVVLTGLSHLAGALSASISSSLA